MKQVFESSRISFVEVSERLVEDYLAMVNDYENVNRFIGGKHKAYTEEQEREWVRKKLEEKALVFSMLEKKSGEFIGNIELMDPTDGVFHWQPLFFMIVRRAMFFLNVVLTSLVVGTMTQLLG